MVRVEESVTIDRPVGEVFTYLADIERQPEWVSSLLESAKSSDEPTGEGTKYRQQAKILGRRFESTNEITAYQPPHVYEFQAEHGPMHVRMRFTLTPEGERTRLVQVADGESGGFFKLADPIVARTMRKQLQADLETLKTMLESGVTAEPTQS
jgi:uncharacterized membrane protein